MDSFKRCTCTKKDAAEILAAAKIMYKKKYNIIKLRCKYMSNLSQIAGHPSKI